MGKWILKSFAFETILAFATEWILGTIKNPNSPDAKRIYRGMITLRSVINAYFEKVPAPIDL